MPRSIDLHKAALCGEREFMEDVDDHCINMLQSGHAKNMSLSPIDFFVICDGHGGKDVADYVVPRLKKHLTRRGLIYPLSFDYIARVYNYIQNGLTNHPLKMAQSCGCTALVVIRYLDEG